MDEDVTKYVRGRKPSEQPRAGSPPPPSPGQPAEKPPKPAATPAKAPPAPAAANLYETVRFQPRIDAGAGGSDDADAVRPVLTGDPVTGWIVIVKGLGRGRSIPLGYGIHSLGRAEDQRIRLNFGDKRISRRQHVMVTYDTKGRSFYVSPGQGSSLAHLNGQPILQMFQLKPGDRIVLGETELAVAAFCGPEFDWQEF